MSPMIIANWKMNLTFPEVCELTKAIFGYKFSASLIIAAPAPYIGYLAAKWPELRFCAQDVSIKNNFGAYTGENPARAFKSLGINYALIGHSERRSLFGETNEIIHIKAQNCLHNNITPIICVGEEAQARKNENWQKILIRQLSASVPVTDKPVIIAYEPTWAIGTKITPTLKEISEAACLINTWAQDTVEKNIRIVYGGSVNSENCRNITNLTGISGVLVGGASLDKNELFKILNF